MTSRPLKLRARDLPDMEVLSAVLQDAVVNAAEMTYLRRERRFVMVASRFRWEHPEADSPQFEEAEDAAPGEDRPSEDQPSEDQPAEDARFEDAGPRRYFERVNAGLCVDRVRRVRTHGFDPRDKERVLNLLAIEARPRSLTLVFSGGARIQLEVSGISCHLEDLGEPWPTPWRPRHEAEEETEGAGDGR